MSVQPVSPPQERPRLAPDQPGAFRQLLLLGVAVLSLLAYGQVGHTYYRDFAVPQGVGMYSLLPEELAHYGMFMAFGLLVALPLATLLGGSSLARTLSSLFNAVARCGWPGALTVALGVTLACYAIAHFVLAHAATCDDEHTYRFIAQTLRTGSLVAPSPGTDLAFFREQFVVLTPVVRYGKYPIGHPLLLAAAMALHAEAWLVPAITGLIALAVYGVGLRVFGRGIAAAATALFAVSPQVLLTGATLVSQPLAALCACGALLCILGADGGRPKLGWLCGAGACLGYGVMTRPLPGLLFAALALAYVVLDRSTAVGLRARLARAAALTLPLAVAAAAMLLVNVAQAADPLVTGYGAIQPSGDGPGVAALTMGASGQRAMSLVGSVIRANFWLFGWPLSLGLCLFARGGRRVALLWGVVGAELCYRLISPKVGVGGTGPIYLYEAVPALCLLSAAGLREVVRRGSVPFLRDAPRAAATMLALGIVALAMFMPPKLQDMRRMADAQLTVHRLIARQGVRHALVFHEMVVPFWTGLSWAYYPPINSPSLDDDVLFMALQRRDGLAANIEFWQRRFPERTAWYFGYIDGKPALVPLTELVEATLPGHAPASPPP